MQQETAKGVKIPEDWRLKDRMEAWIRAHYLVEG
jgi:hypothetical protein